MIRLVVIRHGRTAWNTVEGQIKRFRGLVDLPLTAEGLSQAQSTARRLEDSALAAVYASPLQRARRTAQIIADPHGLTARVLPGLSSMDYGDWAGLSSVGVARRWPDLYRKWRADPFSVPIPGGESTADLRQRATGAARDVLSWHDSGESIALVTHQVVTRTLACSLAGLPNPAFWQISQDLCNLNHFDYDPANGTFSVVGLNDTCHLNLALPRRTNGSTRIILIRHGQTAWNLGAGEERFRGRFDLPLDELGHTQARAVADRLKDEPIVSLYASLLLRTRQTAKPLAELLGLATRPHDGLLDIDYGHFQGLSHSEAAAAFPEKYRLWRSTPSRVSFPGGEALADVQARLMALVRDLSTRHPGQTVALVGHQIVNKVAVCRLLGLDLDRIWQIRQDTCGLDVFQLLDHAWHTLRLNDCCHL